jgi:hypothetical protein
MCVVLLKKVQMPRLDGFGPAGKIQQKSALSKAAAANKNSGETTSASNGESWTGYRSD